MRAAGHPACPFESCEARPTLFSEQEDLEGAEVGPDAAMLIEHAHRALAANNARSSRVD